MKKVDIGLFSVAVAKNIVFQDALPSSQIFEVFSLTFLPFSEVSVVTFLSRLLAGGFQNSVYLSERHKKHCVV